MSRLPRLLCCFLLCLPAAIHAQVAAQFGDVCFAQNIYNNRLLVDPTRDRVYVTFLTDQSVGVIDTTKLSVVAEIPYTGFAQDLALSADGNTLYIAEGYVFAPPPTVNASSARSRSRRSSRASAFDSMVETLDLNTLQLGGSIPMPGPATNVAAGLDGRLYVTIEEKDGSNSLIQVDTGTGTVQATLSHSPNNLLLRTTPDRRTLLVAEYEGEPSKILKYDISTATPALLQSGSAGGYGRSLSVSHNGQSLCVPCSDGNDGNDSTALFSVADLGFSPGKFFNNGSPGPLAFSTDDTLVYQGQYNQKPRLQAFNTNTFALVNTQDLPALSDDEEPVITDIVLDRTGSYLFVSESSYLGSIPSVLAAIATGTGPLRPAAILPIITPAPEAQVAAGATFSFQVEASHQPTAYGAKGLPKGLNIDSQTGLISGVVDPAEEGIYEVQLTASNAAGTVYQTFDIEVLGVDDYPPVVTSATTAAATLNSPFRYQIAGTHRPSTFSASGLPAGLTLDYTGLISGTPVTVGTYIVTLGVQNYHGSNTATLSLTITGEAPVFTSADNVSAYLDDEDFEYQIIASNQPTSYTATGLPDGLSISPRTGWISGYLSEAGIFPVTITATNAAGTTTVTLTLTIISRAPVVVNPGTLQAQVGIPFTYQVSASNQPDSFYIYGLPQGLTYNFQTGTISGTPLQAGTSNLEINVVNRYGQDDVHLTLVVTAATNPPPPPPPTLPKINVMATVPRVVAGSGETGILILTRDGDTSNTLVVNYTVKGSAKNGKDYLLLKGSQKIKAGKSSAKIKIVPLTGDSEVGTKTLKFTVNAATAYELGETTTAKVKIVSGGQ